MFTYNYGEEKIIWCHGTVTKVIKRSNDKVKAKIRWNTKDIVKGESRVTIETLKRKLWNVKKQ